MKNYSNLISSVFVIPLFLFTVYCSLFTVAKAHAQTANCAQIFGGGENCTTHPSISIDKQIRESANGQFRDNLTAISNYFTINQSVNFRIIIRNTTNNTLSGIVVTDRLPDALTFRSGSGRYDARTRTFTVELDRLERGQTKAYTINAEVNTEAQRNGRSPYCLANQATVSQNRRSGSDHVTFCINPIQRDVLSGMTTTKGGLPVYTQTPQRRTPDTGPASLILTLFIPGISGLVLRERTHKK